jgi:hypothetical protein
MTENPTRAAKAERNGYPPFDAPKRVADDLWIVDGAPIRRLGVTIPVRMTVVRLADGTLWLHSPTRFAPGLRAALAELGPVRHLVAPDIAHWTFLAGWQRHCPGAVAWAAPNLRRRLQVRLSEVRFDRDLGALPPADWAADLDQTLVAGAGGFREVAFLHRASRSLILTDLVLNLEDARSPAATRLYARLTGTRAPEGGVPLYLRPLLAMRKAEAARAAARMLDWNPERVIFAHGRWFETDGARRLRRVLGWLVA